MQREWSIKKYPPTSKDIPPVGHKIKTEFGEYFAGKTIEYVAKSGRKMIAQVLNHSADGGLILCEQGTKRKFAVSKNGMLESQKRIAELKMDQIQEVGSLGNVNRDHLAKVIAAQKAS